MFFVLKTFDQRFSAKFKKQYFCKILPQICCFCIFLAFRHEKRLKLRFGPAFGVRSTQTLIEIYNSYVNLTLKLLSTKFCTVNIFSNFCFQSIYFSDIILNVFSKLKYLWYLHILSNYNVGMKICNLRINLCKQS